MMDLLKQRQTQRRMGQTEVIEKPLSSGTAFPTGIASGFLFFRTDLGFLCYYDGTRWLTAHEYMTPIRNDLTQIAATTNFLNVVPLATVFAPYITRIVVNSLVLVTNNGTNFWTIAIVGYNADFSAGGTIDTFTTAAQGLVWTRAERAPNTNQLPTNSYHMSLNVTKTLAPGNLQVLASLYYRWIVT